tara:strand:- start:2350 stop:3336 length:987 start_codon:yes stop_codon:yes gene_type:complete
MKLEFKKYAYLFLGIITISIVFYFFFIRSNRVVIDSDDKNTYDLHVYPWGTQIMIKDLMTSSHTGDVINKEFIWERKPQKYSGFYQLDTGSHLLTDLLMMSRNDLKNNLDKHGVQYDDLHSSGYAYLQGGTPPINIDQDVRIDNKPHRMPVGLMALGEQKNMLREREIVNGVFGLAHIHDGHPLKNYAVTDVLFKTSLRKTIMIDFKNEKMIVGASEPNDYTFKGKMDYGNRQNNMMRMDVWIRDDRGEQNKLLVDTGTLYSQYLYTGPLTLNGIDERGSKGILKMHNAKILPKNLVGVGQKILGYNDLYKGYMYIDYETDTIYINQN